MSSTMLLFRSSSSTKNHLVAYIADVHCLVVADVDRVATVVANDGIAVDLGVGADTVLIGTVVLVIHRFVYLKK